MNFDFADILIEVITLGASDLHLTAGAQPMVREKGRLRPLENFPALSPQDTREVVYSILNNEQRKRLETDWQIDLSYSVPGKARFRVNAYFQRASVGAVMRAIPQDIPRIEDLGVPPVLLDMALDRCRDVAQPLPMPRLLEPLPQRRLRHRQQPHCLLGHWADGNRHRRVRMEAVQLRAQVDPDNVAFPQQPPGVRDSMNDLVVDRRADRCRKTPVALK